MHNIHSDTAAHSDASLVEHIKPYADWAVANDSLLIVTSDEDGFTDTSQGNAYQTRFDPIATIFVGPSKHLKADQYDERIDHLNVLATVLDCYGAALDGFRADFEQTWLSVADPFRVAENRRMFDNLRAIRSIFNRTYAKVN